MNFRRRSTLLAAALLCSSAQAQDFTEALTGGKFGGTFNLRYEWVDEDNALEQADALTLRSALKYTTGTLDGWSALVEVEDVTIVGLDDYSVPQTGFHTGRYSTIADPEVTEINQSYVQYVRGGFTARLGRQDLRYDNQRFIGAVPWRQDFQTFDALSLQHKQGAFTLDYNYLNQRNRVFADNADIDSKDHLLHANLATPIGALSGYAYLLEEDIPLNNGLDTYGVRLSGSTTLGRKSVSYLAEFARQDYERGPVSADANYYLLEAGTTFGKLTSKLGYEVLGSDDARYGFSTPLATLHLFQGWADVFLTTPAEGLRDAYLSLALPMAGGNFTFVYHDYTADDATPSVDDLGEEFDLQWLLPFKEKYQFGLKYANYAQGDVTTRVDKRIFWSWVQLNF